MIPDNVQYKRYDYLFVDYQSPCIILDLIHQLTAGKNRISFSRHNSPLGLLHHALDATSLNLSPQNQRRSRLPSSFPNWIHPASHPTPDWLKRHDERNFWSNLRAIFPYQQATLRYGRTWVACKKRPGVKSYRQGGRKPSFREATSNLNKVICRGRARPNFVGDVAGQKEWAHIIVKYLLTPFSVFTLCNASWACRAAFLVKNVTKQQPEKEKKN